MYLQFLSTEASYHIHTRLWLQKTWKLTNALTILSSRDHEYDQQKQTRLKISHTVLRAIKTTTRQNCCRAVHRIINGGLFAPGQRRCILQLKTRWQLTFGAQPTRMSLTCEHSITWPSCRVHTHTQHTALKPHQQQRRRGAGGGSSTKDGLTWP